MDQIFHSLEKKNPDILAYLTYRRLYYHYNNYHLSVIIVIKNTSYLYSL